jgi:DNA-binding FadR family transcriptional regulator
MNESLRRSHDAFFVQIADRIGQAIIDGVHPVGSALPREADLAVQHKVGRSAIREALKMLAAKGLIESRPRRGTIVQSLRFWNMFDPDVHTWLQRTRPTPELIAELLEIRRAVEPAAAAAAAARANPEAREQLQRALDHLDRAEQDLVDPLASEIAFHVAVVEATGNRFFAALTALVSTAVHFTARAVAAAHGTASGELKKAHRAVAEAILGGRPEEARGAMERLLDIIGTAVQRPEAAAD